MSVRINNPEILMIRSFRTFAAASALALLVGCPPNVDNSGGPPPEGDTIAFAVIADAPSFFCGAFTDAAHLLTDEASVDAFLVACPEAGADARDEIDALQAELLEDESLVLISAALGGCIGDVTVMDVYLDGDTVRPWLLKADSAYGRTDIACTADIGEQLIAVAVSDEQSSIEAEIHVGVYNPDLPNPPITDDVVIQ